MFNIVERQTNPEQSRECYKSGFSETLQGNEKSNIWIIYCEGLSIKMSQPASPSPWSPAEKAMKKNAKSKCFLLLQNKFLSRLFRCQTWCQIIRPRQRSCCHGEKTAALRIQNRRLVRRDCHLLMQRTCGPRLPVDLKMLSQKLSDLWAPPEINT